MFGAGSRLLLPERYGCPSNASMSSGGKVTHARQRRDESACYGVAARAFA